MTTLREAAHTTGHCKEKAKPGGCQLHNLQCNYPACDRKVAQPESEPSPENRRQEAYASIDRLLRNHLDDEDYACFSASLETVYAGAQQVAVPQGGLLSKLVRALEVADKFCGEHTADECADSVALPIAEALDAARCALNHPVIVPRTANPDEMNSLHGECYSVDWEYEPKRAQQVAVPQPDYVPLTDDEIDEIWRGLDHMQTNHEFRRLAIARAFEQAVRQKV